MSLFQLSDLISAAQAHPLLTYNGHDGRVALLSSGSRREIYSKQSWQAVGYSQVNLGLKNMTLFRRLTGVSAHDLHVDFYTQLIRGFSETNREILQYRVQSIEGAVAPTTLIALNRFVISQDYSDKEVRSLLKGCPVRWKKVGGIWIVPRYHAVNAFHERPTILLVANWLVNTATLPTITGLLGMTAAVDPLPEQTESLLEYNSRATNYFSFKYGTSRKHTIPLGVELELENLSSREWSVLKELKNHAIFKRDGSVRSGVEICTAPATLDVHLDEFKKFFAKHKESSSHLSAETNCGLHVHIDRSSLSPLHLASIHKFMNVPENEESITKIAGRSANTYCRPIQYTYSSFVPVEGRENPFDNSERYSRVNLRPSATIEFRLFASTTKYEEFKCRLEFTQAVVDYTRPGSAKVSVTHIPLWSNFTSYVKEKQSLYPQLFSTIFPEENKKTLKGVRL